MAGYKHGDVVTKTTVVEVVYTTVCPVTETVHKPGHTYTTTFTTTSKVYTKVPTVIYETVHGPAVTETAKEVVHKTHTKLIPVTEVKTIDGNTVTVTYTKTKAVVTEVPVTDTVCKLPFFFFLLFFLSGQLAGFKSSQLQDPQMLTDMLQTSRHHNADYRP